MLAREYWDTETLRTLELEREKLPQTLPPITLTEAERDVIWPTLSHG